MTSDMADRGNESPNTSPAGTKGRLFDSAFYQAWALDEDGTWRYLPADATPDSPVDASSGSWRERVRNGALTCPSPGCGAVYTGIRKGAGRLAFVHPKTGATHTDKQSKETLWRLAAQQTVARWVADNRPGASVQTGTGDAATPDVLITLADGTRTAVECRYAAFGTAEWRQRHEEYQQQGIADVWLLANTGPQARKATGAPEQLRPQAAVAELIAAGVPTFWLNPFLGLIGTPVPADGPTVLVTETPLGEWSGPAGAPASAPEPATVAEPAAVSEPPAVEPVASESAAPAAEPVASEPAAPADSSGTPVDPDNAVAATDPATSAGTGTAAETATAEPAEPVEPVEPAGVVEPTDGTESAEVGEPAEAAGPAAAAESAEETTPAAEPSPASSTEPADGSANVAARPGFFRRVLNWFRRPAA